MPITAARRIAGALLAALLALPSCSADPTAATPGAATNWSAAAQEGIAAGEYAPQADGETFRATNRAQNLRAVFGEHGLALPVWMEETDS